MKKEKKEEKQREEEEETEKYLNPIMAYFQYFHLSN